MPGFYNSELGLDSISTSPLTVNNSVTNSTNGGDSTWNSSSSFVINPSIWSNNNDQPQQIQPQHQQSAERTLIQNAFRQSTTLPLQTNVSASTMQQLAYELSLFNLNHHQQQRLFNDHRNGTIGTGGGGSPIDFELLKQRYMKSAAAALDQQRYLSDSSGSPVDYDFLDQRYTNHKMGADLMPISASAATALIAAAAAAAVANANNVDIDLGEDGENQLALLARRRSQNTTECVPVPSSEHVAEIVGRQGCKIKALRAKTNTYIKTPVRGEEPVFVVTGRRDDVEAAKREILSAADHFTQIRASRRHSQGGIPAPGHVTAYVRVPYKVVGLVVGPKGATIKRIQQQTHTYIITPSREKDPVFEVTGLPDNVETARKEIETHIANRTGVYPATTIGTPNSQSLDEENRPNSDFHLNGVDSTLTNSSTATPDSMPTTNGGSSLFSMDIRRDSTNSIYQPSSAPPYFSSFNPFSIATANNEQRRASVDAYFSGESDISALLWI